MCDHDELQEFLDFKCSINPDDYIHKDTYDDWGVAFLDNGKWGVEYNICKDNGKKQSAWYCTEIGDDGIIDTDTCIWTKYEIDFTDRDWKKKLYRSGIEAFKKLWR